MDLAAARAARRHVINQKPPMYDMSLFTMKDILILQKSKWPLLVSRT